MTAIPEVLRTDPFSALSDEERLLLSGKARLGAFAAGEVLHAEGQKGADAGFVLSGLVKLSCSAQRGRECVLYLVRPGHWLDLGILFYEGALPTSAIAVNAGQILWLARQPLLQVLAGNPRLSLQVMASLALRQRVFIHKIAGSQGRISARRRVAAWLLHRARRTGSDTLELDITREILARLIGLSRESLSRELSALSAEGHIELARRRIRLINRHALRRLAES